MSEMEQLFEHIARWTYSAGRPGVPWRVPGIPPGLDAADRQGATNCSTWTAWAILAHYGPEVRDPGRLYRELQVFDAGAPWSPIEGVHRARVGRPIGLAEAPIGRWLLSQSWTRLVNGQIAPGSRGHARLCRRHMGDRLQVLESSASAGGSRDHVVRFADVGRWGAATRFALLD